MTVSEINSYIARQLKFDPILSAAIIVGEISNFKRYSSGHIYFTLKDENSKLACVMFRSSAMYLDYDPKEGEKTEVKGSIGVYEKDGKYQLYVTEMSPIGEGELYKAFLRQKDALEKAGYFVKAQPVKAFPKTIGIVTSKTSAAVRDMLKVLKRRNPKVKVLIFHASVQGGNAAYEIARGIDYFNERSDIDTIIVGRGGGSLEELWAFNELPVVESIFASRIPVVSGVGHETDFTLTDFVADHRAATPSEAAEFAVYPLREYKNQLEQNIKKMTQGLRQLHRFKKAQLDTFQSRYLCQLVQQKIKDEYTFIDSCWNILHNKTMKCFEISQMTLDQYGQKLHALSPLSTLKRGYGVVQKAGKTISDIDDVEVSDRIDIILKNGIIRTEVISKEGQDFNE